MKHLVCGEALIDLIKSDGNNWTAHHGGGPFNTAVALAKLGESVDFLGRLSSDTWGSSLMNALLSAGVSATKIVAASEPTSLAVVELNESGKADYSFYLTDTSNFSWKFSELPNSLREYDSLHIGTLALVIEPSSEILLKWVQQHQAETTIMIDLNVRPSVMPDRLQYFSLIEPWLQLADVIKASDDDLGFLYPNLTWQEAVEEIFSTSSASMVTVTRGELGANLVTRSALLEAVAPQISVIDTVGAGDTFAAGFIARLASFDMLEKSKLGSAPASKLQSALEFAVATAALSCTRSGAQPPDLAEAESFIDGN